MDEPIEYLPAEVYNALEALKLKKLIDPDGELATLWQILRMKRGCRR